MVWSVSKQIRRTGSACARKRTDDRFSILLDFERTFAIPDQKREVKQVLDRLRKVVRVDDESEKVHGAVLLHEQVSNLINAQGSG